MNWLKYKKLYFTLSGLLVVVGIFSLVLWGLNLALDFTGGSLMEYRINSTFSTEGIASVIEDQGEFDIGSIQTAGEERYLIRLNPINEEQQMQITELLSEQIDGDVELLKFETVGPAIGPELVKKTVYAILLAASGILLWVAYQFKSLKYGFSAILAMFHDSFILLGLFSVLGYLYGAEVDFLFVTALLTTLSFSVHDTIVVFDRIREKQRKYGGQIYDLANQAISETMVRSLNNSFTIIFMLFALILLGGTTVKWFAVALFIGTVLGTYSSPFVATPLLVTIDALVRKIRK